MANDALRIENKFDELVSDVGMLKQTKETPDDEKDLVAGTLEACLKVLLRKKTAAEDNAAILQKELDLAKEKIKKLEQAVHRRGVKGKQLTKKLQETEKEKFSLLTELKSCHQQMKEELEKKEKLQNLYTESLRTKNSQIQILEKENNALRQARKFFSEDSPGNISVSQTFNERITTLDEVNGHSSKVSVNFEEEESENSQENLDWDPYFGGVKVSEDNAEGMVENFDMLQLSYTEALRAKNERIKQLEEDFKSLKSHRLLSMSQCSISSDLSFDSAQSDVFSSSAGSCLFSSKSAKPGKHNQARLSLPESNNLSHRRHDHSFSSSDWDPQLKQFRDKSTRRPRIGSLKLQMNSFDSLSPCDSPTHSRSITPTSTVSSYVGVLGNSTALEINSPQNRKSNQLQPYKAEGSHKKKIFLQSPKPLTRRKSPQKKESESAKIEDFPLKDSKEEPQQPERSYINMKQKEKEPENSSLEARKVGNESNEVPSFSLESCSTIRINIEEANASKANKDGAENDRVTNEGYSAEVNLNLTEPQYRRRSTSLSEKRFSPFMSETTKSPGVGATAIPQWKKDLIQKKKLTGSKGHHQDKTEEPEWKSRTLDRKKVGRIRCKSPIM